MKIVVISDIHGSEYWLSKALKQIKDADRYIFLGDFLYHGPRNIIPEGYNPLKTSDIIKNTENKSFVCGNCDAPVDNFLMGFSEPVYYSVETYGDFKLFITHGWDPDIKDSLKMAHKNKSDIILYGHTHISGIENYENTVLFNPGSVALPKSGTPNSCGIIITEKNKLILNLYDIEKNEIYKKTELIK
ncbi:MAG: phosphodiesterase [Thermotogae bacterium]|nr:phosphodiesterase [Thermotogota bacterium]MCP5465963.1 phosphodiesterase [Thermotogota bacterium]HOO74621.1 phosphodiesterase [Tepiditoga sp.]